MGHRNLRLYFDKKNNLILVTEHGPYGGDEINLIELTKLAKMNVKLWLGSCLCGRTLLLCELKNRRTKRKMLKIYEEFPLYKSHTDHGLLNL